MNHEKKDKSTLNFNGGKGWKTFLIDICSQELMCYHQLNQLKMKKIAQRRPEPHASCVKNFLRNALVAKNS